MSLQKQMLTKMLTQTYTCLQGCLQTNSSVYKWFDKTFQTHLQVFENSFKHFNVFFYCH